MNIYASYLYSCQTFSKEKNDARGSFSWWWRRRWEREKLLRTKADDGISNFLFCFVLELVWKLKRIASLFPGQSKTTTFGNFWRVHGSTHSTAEEMSPVKEKKYNFFVCVCVCVCQFDFNWFDLKGELCRRSESSLEHFLSVVIILGVGRWIVLGVMSGRCRINCASQFPNDDEDDRGNENSLKENTKIKWTAIIERKKRCQVTRFDPAHLLCQQICCCCCCSFVV